MSNNSLKSLCLTLALVAVPVGASAQTGDDTTGTTTTETATTGTTQTENRGSGFHWGLLGLLGLAGLMNRKAEPRTEVRLGGPTDGPRNS